MKGNQDDYLVISIIENFLGAPKNSKNSENRVQWEFNCPSKICRQDHNKFNLTYQSNKRIFNCWKCKYRGVIFRLVKDYGSKDDLKRLKLFIPEYNQKSFNVFKRPEVDYDSITCDLPEGYLPLNKQRPGNLYKLAYNYIVNERKITTSQIDKYKIGYTETGPRKFRIILPSFNTFGKINYFEARSYLANSKIPYWKPDFPHAHDIIFNEHLINWDLTVYLVEGVFDALRIPNAIPILGKIPSDLLINKLIEHNATVVICLDSDAIKDGIEIYKMLHSLGLNVFFIDLKGKKDVSKIYEDEGRIGIDNLLKTTTKIDTMFEINKMING